jgi:hypothetical protein
MVRLLNLLSILCSNIVVFFGGSLPLMSNFYLLFYLIGFFHDGYWDQFNIMKDANTIGIVAVFCVQCCILALTFTSSWSSLLVSLLLLCSENFEFGGGTSR